MRTLPELLVAVYRNDRNLLESLSEAEVNLRDQDGRTPLMHAVLSERASSEVVSLLIERGADVDIPDGEQRWTALHFAARDHNEALVRLLLEAGAAVDPVDVFGDTPLWRSVSRPGCGFPTAKLLIDHGADPLRRNVSGVSPLDVARATGQSQVLALAEPHRRRHTG